jgi:hypothetical protein
MTDAGGTMGKFEFPVFDAVSPGRAINDTVTAAICHGMLSRFPTVKLASVENGGSWAISCVKALEKTHPEGMADPLSWAKEMSELFPADDVRKMMGGNMYDLLGLAVTGR